MERVAAQKILENIVDIKEDQPVTDPERRKKLLLREALVEWEKQREFLESKVERKEKRKDQLTNEIYQLVGLYSVFVGVVFTAVLQSTRVECQHVWSPIALCFVAYLVIVYVTWKKSGEIKSLTRLIGEDGESRQRHNKNTGHVKSQGLSAFDFQRHVDEKGYEPVKRSNKLSIVVISILSLFTSMLLVSFVHFLCINVTKCACKD